MAKAIVDYFRARGSVMRLLTERERQVLTCMSRGLTHQAIAAELGIDKATVRTHVRSVLAKLDAHSSAGAIAFYLNPKGPAPPSETMAPAHPSGSVPSRDGFSRYALRTFPQLRVN